MFRAALFSSLLCLAAGSAGASPEHPAAITPALDVADLSAPVPDADDFPRPAILAPNIAFWIEAFSYYSEYQSVIHSEEAPEKVYAVLDFRNDVVRAGPAEARRLQSRAEKAMKREINEHLRRLHANHDKPDELAPGERKLYDMFADSSDPNRFRNAVGTFRAQRGLKEKTERAMRVSSQYLPKMESIFA